MQRRFKNPVNVIPALIFISFIALCLRAIGSDNHAVMAAGIAIAVVSALTAMRYIAVGVKIDGELLTITSLSRRRKLHKTDISAVAIGKTYKGSQAPQLTLADGRVIVVWSLAEGKVSRRLTDFDEFVSQWIDPARSLAEPEG